MYVGMTRAKDELIVLTGAPESVFLHDIPEEYMKTEQPAYQRKPDMGEQMSLFG